MLFSDGKELNFQGYIVTDKLLPVKADVILRSGLGRGGTGGETDSLKALNPRPRNHLAARHAGLAKHTVSDPTPVTRCSDTTGPSDA